MCKVGEGTEGGGVWEGERRVEEGPVFHLACKFSRHFGVIDVALGREAPEGEMVVDQEHDELPAAVADLEAPADFVGEHLRSVDVFAHVFGTTGIVQENGEVECVRILDVDEELAVAALGGVVGVEKGVELIDASKGVLVGGVAMEKLDRKSGG